MMNRLFFITSMLVFLVSCTTGEPVIMAPRYSQPMPVIAPNYYNPSLAPNMVIIENPKPYIPYNFHGYWVYGPSHHHYR